MEQRQGMPAHGQHGDDHGQRQGPPEAPGEVLQLRVFLFLQLGQHRLQGHAALGAGARAYLADFRVHGAGVFGGGVRMMVWWGGGHALNLQCPPTS
ncbi:hypothetical protein D3C81_1664490 [compost metagenome]